jgi:heat shock protein HtpX
MVEDLVQSSKVSLPQTYVVPGKVANAAICDRIFKQDVVICSESLVATLNDQELKGILAHELAHAGRSLKKFNLCSKILRSASLPSCILGASLGLLESGAAIPLAFAGGLLGGMGLDISLERLNAYISRKTELKTDLRAVAMTGEPESLISALEKLTAGEPAAGSLSSHPSTHERASLVRKVFGRNQEKAS